MANERNFTEAELAGRKKYDENYLIMNGGNYRYRFSKYIYEKYDVIYDDIDRVDEIKNRNIYTGNYIEKGYMLEKNKFDALRNHREGYYVNFFKDSIIIWDIAHMPYPVFKWRWMTKTTANGTYGQERVLKLVTDLPYDMASFVFYKKRLLNQNERQRAKRWFKDEYEAHKYDNKENKEVA